MVLRIAAAAALLLGAGAALACSCADVSRASPARLADFVAQAERVVHARVVSAVPAHLARIQVIEAFKGSGDRLEALRGNQASCV